MANSRKPILEILVLSYDIIRTNLFWLNMCGISICNYGCGDLGCVRDHRVLYRARSFRSI